MRIYLAGPMRNIPDGNFPAFRRAAYFLRQDGHNVFNPVERDEQELGMIHCPNGTLEEMAASVNLTPDQMVRNCFLADVTWICQAAEAIALLPGWEKSKGATAEKALGEAIGLKIIYL